MANKGKKQNGTNSNQEKRDTKKTTDPKNKTSFDENQKEVEKEVIQDSQDKQVTEETQKGNQEHKEKKEEKENIEHEDQMEQITALEGKIEQLEEEKSSLLYQTQRLQADFINFRNRVNKEKENLNTDVKIEIIAELLPVIDNFERALASYKADDDFCKGVEMIYRQLTLFLEKQGVEVIPAVGEPFDHNFHEAVQQVDDEEYESGIIIEELQKGYKLNDKVIRPSMVKVAQ